MASHRIRRSSSARMARSSPAASGVGRAIGGSSAAVMTVGLLLNGPSGGSAPATPMCAKRSPQVTPFPTRGLRSARPAGALPLGQGERFLKPAPVASACRDAGSVRLRLPGRRPAHGNSRSVRKRCSPSSSTSRRAAPGPGRAGAARAGGRAGSDRPDARPAGRARTVCRGDRPRRRRRAPTARPGTC